MASVAVDDDHLLHDILTGEREHDLGGIAPEGVATTGLWLFRLCSSLADPRAAGKLSEPVAGLPADVQARFRAQLTALPDEIGMLPMRELSWLTAELQQRHLRQGQRLVPPRWSTLLLPLIGCKLASPCQNMTLGPTSGPPPMPTAPRPVETPDSHARSGCPLHVASSPYGPHDNGPVRHRSVAPTGSVRPRCQPGGAPGNVCSSWLFIGSRRWHNLKFKVTRM